MQEFSLAREQREQELEKERLQKQKEDAKERERKARQDHLDRLNVLSKRSRPRGRCIRGHGSEHSRGDTSDSEVDTSSAKSEDTSVPPPRVTLGVNGDAVVGGSVAEGEGEEVEEDEDEDALHCLCQLPAATARFRTLMTCDVCHNWFHPACVRLKARCANT